MQPCGAAPLSLELIVVRYRALHPSDHEHARLGNHYFDLSENTPYRSELLACFSAFAQDATHRRINWPQSFARRGLRLEDYSLKSRTYDPNIEFLWSRRPEAPTSLPLLTTFKRDQSADTALQGHVLTWINCFPLLFARPLDSIELDVEVRGLLKIIPASIDKYALPYARTQELWDACVWRDDQRIEREFLNDWNPVTDFATVCHSMSLGADHPTMAPDRVPPI